MQKSNRKEIRLIFTMRAQPKAAYLPCSSDLTGHWGGGSVAMWKRDRRLLLPQRHCGYLAELHKDAKFCVSFIADMNIMRSSCSLYLKRHLITE